MRPDDFDAARLWDMIAYAREIVESLRGLRFEQYLGDKNLRLATERRIEIIGGFTAYTPTKYNYKS